MQLFFSVAASCANAEIVVNVAAAVAMPAGGLTGTFSKELNSFN